MSFTCLCSLLSRLECCLFIVLLRVLVEIYFLSLPDRAGYTLLKNIVFRISRRHDHIVSYRAVFHQFCGVIRIDYYRI